MEKTISDASSIPFTFSTVSTFPAGEEANPDPPPFRAVVVVVFGNDGLMQLPNVVVRMAVVVIVVVGGRREKATTADGQQHTKRRARVRKAVMIFYKIQLALDVFGDMDVEYSGLFGIGRVPCGCKITSL